MRISIAKVPGTGDRWRRGFAVLAVLAVVSAFAAVQVARATNARADASGCSPVKIIGVRGSGEDNDGGGDPLLMGNVLYPLYNDVLNRLPGMGITGYGLPYPAYGFEQALFGGVPLDQVLTQLTISVLQGEGQLYVYLDNEVINCPDERIVLIGFSQGAMVVGNFIQDLNTNGPIFPAIVAAVLWADPNFNQDTFAAIPPRSASWTGTVWCSHPGLPTTRRGSASCRATA